MKIHYWETLAIRWYVHTYTHKKKDGWNLTHHIYPSADCHLHFPQIPPRQNYALVVMETSPLDAVAEEKSKARRGKGERERGKDCERKEASCSLYSPKSSDFSSYSPPSCSPSSHKTASIFPILTEKGEKEAWLAHRFPPGKPAGLENVSMKRFLCYYWVIPFSCFLFCVFNMHILNHPDIKSQNEVLPI